jgi:hypothetical protein
MSSLIDKVKFRMNAFMKLKKDIPDMIEKREVIEYYRSVFQPRLFIETGTFFGDTIEHFKNKFDSIVSIELDEKLANKAIKRFEAAQNIQIVQGDSTFKLPALIANISGTVLFWLDGHYSSEFYVNTEFIRTAKGETNTPIEKELDIILQSTTLVPIILIDDARLFNGKEDYPSLAAIKRQIKSYKKDFSIIVQKDIIQVIPPYQ